MVTRLMGTPGCDVSILDVAGNNPIHLAAALPHPACLNAILMQSINGMRSTISKAINAYNYNGK